jgi:nucleoid-associated protein YgaU
MADLNQLKQKYAPVLQAIEQFSAYGAKVDNVALDGDKLLLQATSPSQVVTNRIWDSIKSVDPQYSDLHHEINTTGGPNQAYTIQAGDNLSKISKLFYGSPNYYEKIALASNISDPNKIRPGESITVPPLG